ncbi:unnamed protein product [Amoebophrya sp. A120]|nr:unnamed protein product [Amoebophrya sp. A120]|eukprot:GSA120T00004916001.1
MAPASSPTSQIDPAEARQRFLKFFQALQLADGLPPNEAAKAAIDASKTLSKPTPALPSGRNFPNAEELVKRFASAASASSSDDKPALTAATWEQFAELWGDFFCANQILLPKGKPATETDPSVDLDQLQALYQLIESAEIPKEPDAMDVDAEGKEKTSPRAASPSEMVVRHLGNLCNAISKENVAGVQRAVDAKNKSSSSSASPSGGPSASSSSSDLLHPGGQQAGGSSSSTAVGGPASSPVATGADSAVENCISNSDSPGELRILFLIFFHPCLQNPDRNEDSAKLLRAFRGLSEKGKEILATWLADLDIAMLRSQLQTIQQYLSITFLDIYHEEGADDENAPEHVWDMFVVKSSQLCKNALSYMELIWKANQIRIKRRREYRKEELTKGTAAMLRSVSKGMGATGGEVLPPEEFRNDAMNDVDNVLRHDYYHAVYFEFYQMQDEDEALSTKPKPKQAKSLHDISEKSALNTYTFGLLEHNFCLDANSKCRLLMISTADQQRHETRQEILSQVMQGQRRVNPYFTLKVRRDNLIQDTLMKLGAATPSSFRKQLKVVFEGEQGVDEGGVQKEFFQLLLDQLYDPNYAMFNYNPDNKTYWFNLGSFENNLQYELFGTLLGIAIYNHVILDIRFPLAVYQKLLSDDATGRANFTVDDLLEVSPDMGRSLLQLLEFEGNVEETFCRDFVASYESFGAEIQVPLKEGGESIPVTNENRGEFVSLYVDWFFNKSVFDKFRSFKKGFLRCFQPDDKEKSRVVQGPSGQNLFLSLFRASELELLICGNEVLDFASLKSNTIYQDGFESDSDTVAWFWEIVLDDFVEEERKSLLSFCTGSSRAPPKGLGAPEAKLTIGRQGPDSEALPTAHTCFNHLLIPEYSDKEKLRAKLKLAIANNQGFGLI